MGVYLMLIGTSDVIYRDQYNRYALSWMDSWCCQSAGFLAVLSCEVYYAYLLTYLLTLLLVVHAIPRQRPKKKRLRQLKTCDSVTLVMFIHSIQFNSVWIVYRFAVHAGEAGNRQRSGTAAEAWLS